MTVIWQERDGAVLYQVRQQGETLCLYANGVQHSEYHPQRLLTGSVWDLLWLPALLQDAACYQRVLVLGLGGGSLVAPIRALLDPELFVAVELDACHVRVALEVFAVSRQGVEVIEGDAQVWLRDYQGPPFDLIIEDLFTTCDEQVVRAVAADTPWLTLLASHLTARGVLVMNFADQSEYQASAASGSLLEGFRSRFQLSCSDCHNAVLAFTRQSIRSRRLHRQLRRQPLLARQQEQQRLDFHIRQLD